MLGDVFERFVQKSPISVMVRACLERVLGADRLDLWYERTAQKQYTRELLFSSVYDLMNQVVFCVQPSVRAAYRAHQQTPPQHPLRQCIIKPTGLPKKKPTLGSTPVLPYDRPMYYIM